MEPPWEGRRIHSLAAMREVNSWGGRDPREVVEIMPAVISEDDIEVKAPDCGVRGRRISFLGGSEIWAEDWFSWR
jgi:hypothetical protein